MYQEVIYKSLCLLGVPPKAATVYMHRATDTALWDWTQMPEIKAHLYSGIPNRHHIVFGTTTDGTAIHRVTKRGPRRSQLTEIHYYPQAVGDKYHAAPDYSFTLDSYVLANSCLHIDPIHVSVAHQTVQRCLDLRTQFRIGRYTKIITPWWNVFVLASLVETFKGMK